MMQVWYFSDDVDERKLGASEIRCARQTAGMDDETSLYSMA